jgi:hypothetical protein
VDPDTVDDAEPARLERIGRRATRDDLPAIGAGRTEIRVTA